MQSLLNSAIDLSTELYDFTSWLSSHEFIEESKTTEGLKLDPLFSLHKTLAYHDYSPDNGMGFGLKTLEMIGQGEQIMTVSPGLGIIGNKLEGFVF